MTLPDKQGLNAALLCAMEKGISGGKLANVDDIVVIRHGVLVYERYFDYPPSAQLRPVHAAQRSFHEQECRLAAGRHRHGPRPDQGAGRSACVLSLRDKAALANLDKDRITLRHLLTMSAGLGFDREPGAAFRYSNTETELIGAILKKVTGKTVDVLAQESIFAPLGINDVEWLQGPVHRSSHVGVRTESAPSRLGKDRPARSQPRSLERQADRSGFLGHSIDG